MDRSRTVPRMIAALLALGVSLAQAGAAPGGTGQAAASVADKLSKDWMRVRTAHFEAVSNAPLEKVREILGQLEAFHRYLVMEFLALRTESPAPTLVVIFKDGGAFSKFKPRTAGGGKRERVAAYFLAAPDMNHIVLPVERDSEETFRLIFHEYYHFVIHRNIPEIPAWADEGLAEFSSTYKVDLATGESYIGKPIENHIQWLRHEKLLPLEQMLTQDGALRILRGKNTRPVAVFYAQSWALVHYLMIGQEARRQPQLKAYLAAVKRGLPTEKAFVSAFGMTFADMERELKTYADSSNYYIMMFGQKPEDLLASSTAEALTDVEAQYRQADLLLRLGADTEAEEILKRIRIWSPDDVPAKISLAVVLQRSGRASEAIELLRPVAERDAADFRAHLVLAGAYAQNDLLEDAVREYGTAAAANVLSTAPWQGLSLTNLRLGRQAESDAAMKRLQEIEARPDWYSARAYEGFKTGRYDVAAGDARAYIERAGRGAESSPYMAFLGALSLLRLGRAPESGQLLDEVRPEIPADSWQMKVMDFLQGRTAADTFLSMAKDVYELTEAHAYIGIKDLIAGRRAEAIVHFRWVKERGSKDYVEYGLAVAELTRLEAEENGDKRRTADLSPGLDRR